MFENTTDRPINWASFTTPIAVSHDWLVYQRIPRFAAKRCSETLANTHPLLDQHESVRQNRAQELNRLERRTV